MCFFSSFPPALVLFCLRAAPPFLHLFQPTPLLHAMTTCSDPIVLGPVATVNTFAGPGGMGCRQCLHRESAAYRRRVFDLPCGLCSFSSFPPALVVFCFSTVPFIVDGVDSHT